MPLSDSIYVAMRDFRLFDCGYNQHALVYGKHGRDGVYYAVFDTIGIFGRASRARNPAVVPVRIACDPGLKHIVGDTAGDHMLIGQRRWTIDFDGSTILVSTEAFERPRGLFNRIGMLFGGRLLQRRIWKAYLENISSNFAVANTSAAPVKVDPLEHVAGNPWQPIVPYPGCDCNL